VQQLHLLDFKKKWTQGPPDFGKYPMPVEGCSRSAENSMRVLPRRCGFYSIQCVRLPSWASVGLGGDGCLLMAPKRGEWTADSLQGCWTERSARSQENYLLVNWHYSCRISSKGCLMRCFNDSHYLHLKMSQCFRGTWRWDFSFQVVVAHYLS